MSKLSKTHASDASPVEARLVVSSSRTTGPMDVDQMSTPMSKSISDLSGSTVSASTAPSSVEMMQIDKTDSFAALNEQNNAVLADPKSDSDVEVIDASSPTSSAKRKADDNEPLPAKSKPVKKPKVEQDSAMVELRGNKLALKQKALNWSNSPSVLKARLALTEYLKEQLEKDDSFKLSEWPAAHRNVVAYLIHESDKTLAALTKSVKKDIVTMLEGAVVAPAESQDSQPDLEACVDSDAIKSLINSLATRTNYGIDVSDVPDGLPEGVADVPATLQIWKWELDSESMYPDEFTAKRAKRKSERETAKQEAVKLFVALEVDQRVALLRKQKVDSKDAAASGAPSSSNATPSSSAAAPKKAPAKPKVDTDEKAKAKSAKSEQQAAEKAEKEAARKAERDAKEAEKLKEQEEKQKVKDEKAKKKAEEDAAKAEKKAVRDAAKAEKDAVKAAKEAAKAKKAAEEEKKLLEQKKQANMLTAFLKRSASPVPAPPPAPAGVAPAIPGPSHAVNEFDNTFRPFHIKQNVTVAPVNRSNKYGKQNAVDINSMPDLDRATALKQYLADCPKWRRPKYDPCPTPKVSVRQLVQAINDSSLTGDDPAPYFGALKDPSKVQTKFLKFHEDVRPGYVGTWTKTSKVVTPRTPFGRETALLRYDYDSEAEWDEGDVGSGEDVASDGDESEAGDDGSEIASEDGWMCDDDEIEYEEGYQSGDELMPDVDGTDAVLDGSSARQKIVDRERKHKMIREARRKGANKGPLLPVVVGLVWEKEIGQETGDLRKTRLQFINDAYPGLDPFKFESTFGIVASFASGKPVSASASSSKANGGTPLKADPASSDFVKPNAPPSKEKKKVSMPIASHLMSDFVKFVGEIESSSRDMLLGLVKTKFTDRGEKKVTKLALEQTLIECKPTKAKTAEGKTRWILDESEVARLSGRSIDTQ